MPHGRFLPALFATSVLLQIVFADGGTVVNIDAYTDINCKVPSTIHPNISVELDVCVVTPGLGSIILPTISCSTGVVQAWGFSDTVCGNQDTFYKGINNCKERANPGAYAAIQLSCNQNGPDVAVGTTTISIGQIATAGSGNTATATTNAGSSTGSSPSTTHSTASGTSPTASTSSTGNGSVFGGFNSLSQGARTGIIVGCIAAFVLLLSLGLWRKRTSVSNLVHGRKRPDYEGHNPPSAHDLRNLPPPKGGMFGDVAEVGNRDAESARQWMARLKHEVHPIFFPRERGIAPVRVAILDTGASFDDQTSRHLYKNRIVDHWSWCATPNSAQGQPMFTNRNLQPEGKDLDGHGTHATSVLLEVAPFCEVYVAKVFDGRQDMGDDVSSAITAQRVSNAIVHAVQHWQVDIISMSFGFEYEIEAVRRAIDYATDGSRPMLVFAAASNTGGNDRIHWPASHDRVICIHATDGDGNKYGRNPTPEGKPHEFATLGCSVESWLGPDRRASKSGTSVATPIAAGIAALTLDFMRAKRNWYLDHTVSEHNHDPATWQSVRNWQAASYDDNVRRLGMCAGMSAVFALMAKRSRDGYRYIRPWSVLHNRYTHPSALIHKITSEVDHRNQ